MSQATTARKVVGIRFQPLGKLYHFDASAISEIQPGDYVMVNTSRGRELGQVIGFVAKAEEVTENDLKPVERRATPQELVMRRMWQRRELEAMIECRAQAADLGLRGVKIAAAEFSFDGSRLCFLYYLEGDEKVDLMELRRRMRRAYRKSRVEMRQVGPRDVAKLMGGMGACGLEERCCAKFLTEFSPISIRMAKAQGVSLNPQEITGMCGRLRCCLLYEYEQYMEARKHLPKRKKRVITPQGEGKVVDHLPLKQSVVVLLQGGSKMEFHKDEVQPYEEYKALEQKAKEPCDRHENGDCSCGRNGG